MVTRDIGGHTVTIADAIEWPDGSVSVKRRWEPPVTEVYRDMAEAMGVVGGDDAGRTRFVTTLDLTESWDAVSNAATPTSHPVNRRPAAGSPRPRGTLLPAAGRPPRRIP